MCNLGQALLGGFGMGILKKVLGKSDKSADRQAATASAALNSQEQARKANEELRKKQRKATETILTSGQGLAGTQTGVTLG